MSTKALNAAKKTLEDFGFKGKYLEAVGRRKTAIARVRLYEASEKPLFIINGRDATNYFPTEEMRVVVHKAQETSGTGGKWSISAKVIGGGIHAQSEAVRHGIARALVKFNEELRKDLKKGGMLKRDPRAKERKKFGLKKARKRAQWSKR